MRFAGKVLAFVLFLAAVPALAGDKPSVSTADKAEIQKVIQGQVDAFRRDDGAAAFGYASPTIHEIFHSPDVFLGMVKSGYQPVYRPRRFDFGLVDFKDGKPVQHVWVVGPDGEDVEALYYMERQPNGHWLINGCELRKSNAV